jgi:hypothetical protein
VSGAKAWLTRPALSVPGKEHAAGEEAVGVSYLRTSFGRNVAFPVPIVVFEPGELDTLEDILREKLQRGESLSEWLRSFAARQIEEARAETGQRLLALVIDARHPRRKMAQIAFACGSRLFDGLSMAAIARRFRISKEAMQQGVHAVASELGLRQARFMRDAAARSRMSRAYRSRKANSLLSGRVCETKARS